MRMVSEQEKQKKREAARNAKKFKLMLERFNALPSEKQAAMKERLERELGMTFDEALRWCKEALSAQRAGIPEKPLPPEVKQRIRESMKMQRARQRASRF